MKQPRLRPTGSGARYKDVKPRHHGQQTTSLRFVPSGESYAIIAKSRAIQKPLRSFRSLTRIPVFLIPPTPGTPGRRFSFTKICRPTQRLHSCSARICGRALAELVHSVAKTRQAHRVDCPHGLTYAAFPLLVLGSHVATIVAGPVRSEQHSSSTVSADAELAIVPGQDKKWPPQLELLAAVLELMGEHADRLLLARQSAEPESVRRCKDYILQHLSEELTLKGLALMVNMCPQQLNRQFHKTSGLTVMAYVRQVRIRRVKDLLADFSLPVKTIAAEVGFKRVAHFTRFFRNATGQAPTEYRRSLLTSG